MNKWRFNNRWRTLPKGAGWSFSIFEIWDLNYAGGGGTQGIAMFGFAIEKWKPGTNQIGVMQSERPKQRSTS